MNYRVADALISTNLPSQSEGKDIKVHATTIILLLTGRNSKFNRLCEMEKLTPLMNNPDSIFKTFQTTI